MSPGTARLLGTAWLVLLGAALLASAAGAYSRTRQFQERPSTCDAFGYLTMTGEVRRAASEGRFPDYAIETPRTRVLVDHLKSRDLPVESWYAVVGPHAYRYFPESGRVGPQYPPGTALLLALFPPGEAVRGLSLAVIVVFLAAGFLTLVAAFVARAWAAAGGVVLALQVGLDVLGAYGEVSYSVGLVLVPLLLASALLLAAAARPVAGRPWASGAAAFLAGVCFGVAVLVRLPALFLLPGAVILTLGATRRTLVTSRTVAFGLGFALFGAVPLLHHQHRVAGAWYLTTYGTIDASPPLLDAAPSNLRYYFCGPGSDHAAAPAVAAVGFLGLALSAGTRPPAGWSRPLLSAAVIWALPTAYFLTHIVTIPYYAVTGVFAAVAVLGLGGFVLWVTGREPEESGGAKPRWALAAAFLPGLLALQAGLRAWPSPPEPADVTRIDFPAELTDARAWVFADHLTVWLWSSAGQPAYKLPFGDEPARLAVYRFVFDRGEPVYVIRDSDGMGSITDELREAGAVLEPRGSVAGCPYFLVHWPAGGP